MNVLSNAPMTYTPTAMYGFSPAKAEGSDPSKDAAQPDPRSELPRPVPRPVPSIQPAPVDLPSLGDFKGWLSLLESLRRERKNMDSDPLPAWANDLLAKAADLEDGTPCDYSFYGSLIDQARSALDEALPNGQYMRASVAMLLMEAGTKGLASWMRIRGYGPDYATLAEVRSLGFQEGGRISLPRDPFALTGKLSEGCVAKLELSNETISSDLAVVVKSVKRAETSSGPVLRVLESVYERDDALEELVQEVRLVSTRRTDVPVPPEGPEEIEVVEAPPVAPAPITAVAPEVETGVQMLRRGDRFFEPGTGLLMYRGLWYIIGDSGSSYTPIGFTFEKDAYVWWNATDWAKEGTPLTLILPTPDMNDIGELPTMEAANLVQGESLLQFWIKNDPETLVDTQRVHDRLGTSVRVDEKPFMEKLATELAKTVNGLNLDSLLNTPDHEIAQSIIESIVKPELQKRMEEAGGLVGAKSPPPENLRTNHHSNSGDLLAAIYRDHLQS